MKNRVTYSENGDAYGMIGGYGVWRYDKTTDERSYVPFRCVGWWTELVYRTEDKSNEAGLFLAYIKNLGTSCPIIQTALLPVTCCDATTEKETSLITSLFPDVDSTFRISPRIALGFAEVFTIYFEIEWTRTWWGYNITRCYCSRFNVHRASNQPKAYGQPKLKRCYSLRILTVDYIYYSPIFIGYNQLTLKDLSASTLVCLVQARVYDTNLFSIV